jgi:23S rRNA (uracil1939-C5)-methyltransferase
VENNPEVLIESLAYTGNGVAHLPDGKTVFVTGSAPGDTVRIRIDEIRDRFEIASIVELLDPSPHRIHPLCPYHDICGGCNLQHIDYAEQRRWKRQFVVDALQRIGIQDAAEEIVSETVCASSPWNYRNKIELVPHLDHNRLSLGYHQKNSNATLAVDCCQLLPKGFEDMPKRLAGALNYSLKDSASSLKRVGVRISQRTGDIDIALWTEPGAFNRSFIAKVLNDACKSSSIERVLVKGPLKKRDDRGVEVLAGKGFWEEELAGFRYRISAPSFFQVNTEAAHALIQEVIKRLDPTGKRIADLYSGAGTFTLPITELADELYAVEIEGHSVRDLRRNLALNGMDAEVLGGGIEYMLPELPTLDAAVIDPPRSGLSTDALSAIKDTSLDRLVYVSCDPTTLARDTKSLAAQGFMLKTATPIDLFPQTYHIETVAQFTR